MIHADNWAQWAAMNIAKLFLNVHLWQSDSWLNDQNWLSIWQSVSHFIKEEKQTIYSGYFYAKH